MFSSVSILRNQLNERAEDEEALPKTREVLVVVYDDSVDANSVAVDISTITCGIELIKKKCKLLFNNDNEKQRMVALFDCGSTNSLICKEKLSLRLRTELNLFLAIGRDANRRGFKKFPVTIRGVNGCAMEDCVVARVNIRMGKWSGIQSFVISSGLNDKD
ncbi:hypothetical protein BpHYR1_047130 [Brachionus plicatilis]|uniref:Uncharacterized protein n=1 Tax=Brachionus plicatilis TaxID=10195 RepID=A0A3M7RNJ4_BRAPC|nr:hypothetical protein BpHYR1_047130 [Brachionus plicatilis]